MMRRTGAVPWPLVCVAHSTAFVESYKTRLLSACTDMRYGCTPWPEVSVDQIASLPWYTTKFPSDCMSAR